MQSTQVKYISSDPSILSISIQKTTDFPSTNLSFPKYAVPKAIVALSRKKKRPFGSLRSTAMVLESAYFIASKLKVFPEPLDTIIREFVGGGNGGGGFKFWRRHRWGGFDGRKKTNWGFWALLAIIGVGLCLILVNEYELNVFSGVLGLALFGISVNVLKTGVLDWALGFCCCAALVGFCLKKEDLQKLVRFLGTIKIARRRKRRLF